MQPSRLEQRMGMRRAQRSKASVARTSTSSGIGGKHTASSAAPGALMPCVQPRMRSLLKGRNEGHPHSDQSQRMVVCWSIVTHIVSWLALGRLAVETGHYVVCCDFEGRKINFANSKTLVGRSVSRPTVARVTFDLPEC